MCDRILGMMQVFKTSTFAFRVELEDRVVSLEKHVQQLRNVIAKHTGSSMPQVGFAICLFVDL